MWATASPATDVCQGNFNHTTNMKRLILAAIMALPVAAHAQKNATQTTGGLWQEINLTKVLPYDWSVGVEGDLRTTEWNQDFNRASIGVFVNKKLGKYVKLGLSYSFIEKHFLETCEYKYKGDNDFSSYQGTSIVDADGVTRAYQGYNLDAPHWVPRHRISFDVSADKRFWKTLRVAVRERYQFTHQNARDVERTRYRDPSYDSGNNITGYDEEEQGVKEKAAWNRHLLRSRLKLSIDKKGWMCEPFASVEFHNNMSDSWHLDKLRAAAGVEFSVSKTFKISAAYVFTHENDDDGDDNIHAISIGHSIKF